MVKATGAKKLVTACAEGYRMWKVDYPKLLDIATADLGFEVIHLLEYADEALKKGSLKLTKPVEAGSPITIRAASAGCAIPGPRGRARGAGWAWLSRGSRDVAARRGLYAQPRNILNAIPGVDVHRDDPDQRELLLLRGRSRHQGSLSRIWPTPPPSTGWKR